MRARARARTNTHTQRPPHSSFALNKPSASSLLFNFLPPLSPTISPPLFTLPQLSFCEFLNSNISPLFFLSPITRARERKREKEKEQGRMRGRVRGQTASRYEDEVRKEREKERLKRCSTTFEQKQRQHDLRRAVMHTDQRPKIDPRKAPPGTRMRSNSQKEARCKEMRE